LPFLKTGRRTMIDWRNPSIAMPVYRPDSILVHAQCSKHSS
jgi:hypothetical protein